MSALQAQVKGADDAVALLRELVGEAPIDGLLVVGLDAEQRLCGVALDSRHRALSWVKVWELAALAAELDACALVIGSFPSGQPRPPSRHEVDAFVALHARGKQARVLVLDCIVVRGHRWWSLRERSGRFPRPACPEVATDG
jgi:DNA repair protein RadC